MTYTVEQLEAHMGRPLTELEAQHSRLLVPSKAKGKGNVLVVRAYCQCASEMLDTPIPDSALIQVYGSDEEGNPNKTGLVLRDFTINAFDDGETARFALSARFGDCYRTRYTDVNDLVDWLEFLAQFGVTADDLLTVDEYRAKLPQGDM